jgi:hypothetical protein
MITRIPEGQICQAFDPRMIMTNDEIARHGAKHQPNTSCVVPAYVYVEGKHGKKFLCDTHYYYEIYMNRQCYSAPNHSVTEITQYLLNETERVKETFAKNITSTETLGYKCSLVNYYNKGGPGCTADALVKINLMKMPSGVVNFVSTLDPDNISKDIFYCNFHFRRTYARYINNGVVFEDYIKVLDERYRMTMTLDEEFNRLTYI